MIGVLFPKEEWEAKLRSLLRPSQLQENSYLTYQGDLLPSPAT
jgi:hypothetical protein